jgi:peptide chain release factor 1
MADTSLLSRLDGIEARFEEVSTLITDPSVIADMKRYVRLTKEYKETFNKFFLFILHHRCF